MGNTTHEYAAFFPLMEGDEFAGLVADIKANGLLEPIVTYKGKTLDGRNRERACKEAGVSPQYTHYKGLNPVAYVWSKNAHRRHLTPTQLGVVASDMKPLLQKEARKHEETLGIKRDSIGRITETPKGIPVDKVMKARRPSSRWSKEAAKTAGIGETTIKRVDRVRREAPDLVPKMRSGELTASAATKVVRQRKAAVSVETDVKKTKKAKRQTEDRDVAIYLEATDTIRQDLSTFWDAMDEAVDVGSYGKFSPEAQGFVKQRHQTIRDSMSKITEKMDEVEQEFNA